MKNIQRGALVCALLIGIAGPAFAGGITGIQTVKPQIIISSSLTIANGVYAANDTGSNVVFGLVGLPPDPWITLTVYNNQSAATGANWPQQISFNPSKFTANESAGLGNIRFYQGKQTLYSWCESGCNSTATNAIFWVVLPSGIAAESTANLNLTIETKTLEYDGIYAGEAPQLSPKYGEYDNGAAIFTFYNDFKGTAINSTWITGAGCFTVDNGLGFQGCTNLGNRDTISDSYAYPLGSMIGIGGYIGGSVQIGSTAGQYDALFMLSPGGPISLQDANGYGASAGNLGPAGNYVLDLVVNSSQIMTAFVNGSFAGQGNLNDPYGGTGTLGSMAIGTWAQNPNPSRLYYIYGAPNGPGGIMPKVQFGSENGNLSALVVIANLTETFTPGLSFGQCSGTGPTTIECPVIMSAPYGTASIRYDWDGNVSNDATNSISFTLNTCGLRTNVSSLSFGGTPDEVGITGTGSLSLRSVLIDGTAWIDSAEAQSFGVSNTTFSLLGIAPWTALSSVFQATGISGSGGNLFLTATSPSGQAAGHYQQSISLETQC